MRPPAKDGPKIGGHRYSEAEWDQIRDILGRVGIDADTAIVSRLPLRQHLSVLGNFYLGVNNKPWWEMTPKERAKRLCGAFKEVRALRRRLYRPYGVGGALLGVSLQQTRDALVVLEALEAKVQERLAALTNPPSRSRHNAQKYWRDAYWRELPELWGQFSGKHRPPAKLAIDFVRACSPEPFQASAKRVANFVSKHKARPR